MPIPPDGAFSKLLKSVEDVRSVKMSGLCAYDIEQRVQLSQPTISHHMAILKKAGLVEANKVGTVVWYRRNENTLKEFTRLLKDTL